MVKAVSDNHPCYNEKANKYARMHIPVAPVCNISCNYCNRKYDCLHETRPGVTSEILTPEKAYEKYSYVKDKVENLSVIGIAGPGDALANFKEVKKSIQLIKKDNSEMIYCLSTNGLNLPIYADDIIDLDVSHVTITINTLLPRIGAQIYRYVKYKDEYYFGIKGAGILINNQLEGLKYLADRGVLCKVNIVMIKGINEDHIPQLVKKVKELGAVMTNIMPLIPAEGSEFADMPLVSKKELNNLRDQCSADIKQMYHCQQCRADAIGQLTQDKSAEFRSCPGSKLADTIDSINIDNITEKGNGLSHYNYEKHNTRGDNSKKYYFALASKSGKIIDQHFGHVDSFYIYSYSNNGIEFIEKRKVNRYCTGEECFDMKGKIKDIIDLIGECTAVLSVRIGYQPKKKLKDAGIEALEMYERVEDGIRFAVEKLDLQLENIM